MLDDLSCLMVVACSNGLTLYCWKKSTFNVHWRAMMAAVTERRLTKLICAFPNLQFWLRQTLLCYYSFVGSWSPVPECLLWKNYPRFAILVIPPLSLSNGDTGRPLNTEKVLCLYRVWTIKVILVFRSFL